MSNKISFFTLPYTVRRLVRSLRYKLLQLYREKKFNRFKKDAELKAMVLSWLNKDTFKSISLSRKKEIADITLYNESPAIRQSAYIWQHEFSEEDYPNVADKVDPFFKIALQLDVSYLLLYLDSIAALNKDIADQILNKITDTSFLLTTDQKILQKLFREVASKTLSNAIKTLTEEKANVILENVSKHIHRQLLKDIEYHEELSEYQSKLACIELVKCWYRL